MGGERDVYGILVEKPDEKRPLGRSCRRWENGIIIDLREIGCGFWIGSSWLRIVTGDGLL
jgi:hypothetical protein